MGTIAGIDLGTTYSALAALNEIGKPEIVPDTEGNRITPSVVSFNGGNSITVGLEAKSKLSIDPTDVVQFVKRKMGDPSHRYLVAGVEYSPIDVSALILKKLKDDCVQHGNIEDVVITVPAHFNEVERKSTMDAGKIAGLNVLGVVNEPTAAAVYYASLSPMNGTVVVYDLGGGTFDVTILNLNGDQMDVLASKGNGHLGGVDFDNFLARRAASDAKSKNDKMLFPDAFFEAFPSESSNESKSYYTVMERAEKAKKIISARGKGTIRGMTDNGDFSSTVMTSEFEEMISSHLMTTEMLLENTLEDAGLSVGDIDKVLLVGGSTRIPKVSQMLESFFGFAPEKSLNPDEAVALGAAILAGKRKVASDGASSVSAAIRAEVGKTSVLECANKFFGTVSVSINEARGQEMLQNTIIIRRGAKLPCEETERFSTRHEAQEEIELVVTESDEDSHDLENGGVHRVGSWLLKLPPNCPKGSPIAVTYGYSEDQRLRVNVELPDGNTFEGELHYADDGNLDQSAMKQAQAKLDAFVVE
jgi:molecular chaperone DnaK